MDFTLYGGDNQGLIKLDPRTKILIFITSELMSLGTYSNIGSTVYVHAYEYGLVALTSVRVTL